MTAGIVTALGRTGRNFGVGRSSGSSYVLDEGGAVACRVNREVVPLGEPDHEHRELLLALLREHGDRTTSLRACSVVARWEWYVPLFRKVELRGAADRVATLRRDYLERFVRTE